MLTRTLLFGLFFTLFTVAASAQTNTPVVKERQENQQGRVKQGVNSGELTRAETADLKRQQRRINRSKRQAKADGEVTKRERARLEAQQNAASRNIARKKHNRRDRN